VDLYVRLFEPHVGEAFGTRPALGLSEHRRRQVDAEHGSRASGTGRHPTGRAGSTPDIEDPV
jgi:hypothetical protein